MRNVFPAGRSPLAVAKSLALVAAIAITLLPVAGGSISVVYAGSLARAMEGPIAQQLLAQTGLHFAGEAKGSKALANLIRAGLRDPDVFVTADPSLLRGLPIERGVVFGSARMVIAYSPKSPHRALFEQAAAGDRSILSALAAPGVLVGRTDPRLDPKGALTIRSLQLLGQSEKEPLLAERVLRHSGVFPEEDLAVRVESGELDAGFFYSIEIPGRGLRTIALPPPANLSRSIDFAVAVMRDAPHPRAAQRFVNFVLYGEGRRILERAGLHYFAKPQQILRSTS